MHNKIEKIHKIMQLLSPKAKEEDDPHIVIKLGDENIEIVKWEIVSEKESLQGK